MIQETDLAAARKRHRADLRSLVRLANGSDTLTRNAVPQFDGAVARSRAIDFAVKRILDRRDASHVVVRREGAHVALGRVDVVQPNHRLIGPHHQIIARRMERHAPHLVSILRKGFDFHNIL